MASASVYYKFKSQREPSRVTFDGTGISVWDLKREIILQNKMGKGIDFDLAIYNPDTDDEYRDDKTIIARSSQVVVRRLPPSKPGRGNAAQYVADMQTAGPNSQVVERGAAAAGPSDRRQQSHRGQMSMRFDGRDVPSTAAATSGAPGPELQTMSSGLEGDEASRIAAMFQATSEQWDETQERMAHATYLQRPGGGPPRRPPPPPRPSGGAERPGGAPGPAGGGGAPFQHSQAHDRPPPIGYICFRCGTKGHWIHDCPTNEDREFDNKPRFKRTTGIPKSMLKTVEAPSDGIRREGVMVTPDGSYVVAQVDSASWARNQAFRQKRLTKSDVYSSVPSDSKLACSLCNKLLRDAVRTPCCQALFCQECITTHLLEHEFRCPECEKRVKDIGDLQRDDDVRKQVREYVDSEMEKSERKLQEAEQAEKEELDKAKMETEPEAENGVGQESAKVEAASVSVKPEDTDSAAAEGVKLEDGSAPANGTEAGGEGGAPAMGSGEWNARAVQQIMMMLCNPQLPPPMRMQLQMQLRFLHNQFVQTSMQQNSQSGVTNDGSIAREGPSIRPMQPQQSVIGAHNISNPFAGQSAAAGSFANGMVGNPMIGMRFANPMGGFQPAANLSHQESAYMRLPVNPNKRTTTAKRERPADFLEVGGSGGGGNKEARFG